MDNTQSDLKAIRVDDLLRNAEQTGGGADWSAHIAPSPLPGDTRWALIYDEDPGSTDVDWYASESEARDAARALAVNMALWAAAEY